MNYIWNRDFSDRYIIDKWPAEGIEAYKNRDGEIIVNPNMRFKKIFSPILESELCFNDDYVNIILHMLAEMDRKSYVNRFTIKRNLLLKDIKDGILGQNLKENINIFSKIEMEKVLNCLLESLDKTDMYKLFEKISKKIFPNASKLYYFESSKNLYIYLGIEKDSETTKKMELLMELFWDITSNLEVYYETHFGIIGIDATMKINHIEID